MLDYAKLYRILFNGLTDAIECMENERGILQAKLALVRAQQAAEDYFLESTEDAPE